MIDHLDDAIKTYTDDPSGRSWTALEAVVIETRFCVPVSEPVKEVAPGRYDVPVICLKTDAGEGAIPAFTSVGHLLKWKPQGCKYTSLSGRALIAMAINMEVVAEILVNPGDVPHGKIPRSDFKRMLLLHVQPGAQINGVRLD